MTAGYDTMNNGYSLAAGVGTAAILVFSGMADGQMAAGAGILVGGLTHAYLNKQRSIPSHTVIQFHDTPIDSVVRRPNRRLVPKPRWK